MSEGEKTTKALKKSVKKNIIQERIDDAVTHDFKDVDFRIALIDLLTTRGSLQRKVAEELLDYQGVQYIKTAFTHFSMLEKEDYELFETMGDATINKCIVWYLVRRFPQIKMGGSSGNEIITELKKKFVDKKSFGRTRLPQLKLERFIRYKELPYIEKGIEKKIVMDYSMKEDVFESVMAAIEDLIDSRIMVNTGYSVIYNIIASLLDEDKNISLNISDIKDPKTKLLEIFSSRKKYGDDIKFGSFQDRSGDSTFWISNLELTFKGTTEIPGPTQPMTKLFKGTSERKLQISEFNSAQQALDWLEQKYNISWAKKSSSII